ncbi:hypothetical protein EDF60_1063 [Leucobacter luti]|uniref:hypothetical protein n=1 Tax=Leucobacter luti TaxID=340320 RepID=UPI00104A8B41|nr:hypothetical protein [Leucobacter luti]MCW2288011.1 hypothetical protein [Leucobacter luti]TCK45827.1 hypothetical protein EDF60_1063 [Leucobacter luti]
MRDTGISSRVGKRGFWIMVVGVGLNALAILAWSLSGPLVPGSAAQIGLMIPAVIMQAGAVGCLLAALLVGIIALAKKARPLRWAVLALLGIPLTLAVSLVEVLILRSVLGL